MVTKNTVEKMLGKDGYKIRGITDSDGDGIINMLDCQPYNKHKQGISHKLGAWVAKKVGAERTAERIEARGKHVDEYREEAKEARWKEEKVQAIETEKYKAKRAGERKRAYIKGGGATGVMMRGFGETAKAISKMPTPHITKVESRRATGGKKKKGKKGKGKRKSPPQGGTPQQSKPSYSMPDIYAGVPKIFK